MGWREELDKIGVLHKKDERRDWKRTLKDLDASEATTMLVGNEIFVHDIIEHATETFQFSSEWVRAFERYRHLTVGSQSSSDIVEFLRDKSDSENSIRGAVQSLKGIMFENRALEYFNSGVLPEGYHAELPELTNEPAYDIRIFDDKGNLHELIQVKATVDWGYVRAALKANPDIHIVVPADATNIPENLQDNITVMTSEFLPDVDGILSTDWADNIDIPYLSLSVFLISSTLMLWKSRSNPTSIVKQNIKRHLTKYIPSAAIFGIGMFNPPIAAGLSSIRLAHFLLSKWMNRHAALVALLSAQILAISKWTEFIDRHI